MPTRKTDKPISNQAQLNSHGELVHLLGLEGLDKHLLWDLILDANQLLLANSKAAQTDFDWALVANLFFEPSTRTRNTFEIAAKRAGAKVINVDTLNSATRKNETILDMIATIQAMQVNLFVIRHRENWLPHYVADNISGISVVNAGDGTGEHPTQALLDMLTIYQHKGKFEGLSVAFIGDISHSRVAHSDVFALQALGTTDIRFIAPHAFQNRNISVEGITFYDSVEAGIKDCDVVINLRLQEERMQVIEIPDKREYFKSYGLTESRLKHAKPNAIIMHPGPINREVEISSEVADGPQSVILQQVTNGIAVRMAVIDRLAKTFHT